MAEGKIGYTVADNDVAQLNKTCYPNLNISLAVSFDQRASWAVQDEPLLAKAMKNISPIRFVNMDISAEEKPTLSYVKCYRAMTFIRRKLQISIKTLEVFFEIFLKG